MIKSHNTIKALKLIGFMASVPIFGLIGTPVNPHAKNFSAELERAIAQDQGNQVVEPDGQKLPPNQAG